MPISGERRAYSILLLLPFLAWSLDAAAQVTAAPSSLAGVALGVASITWTWDAVGGASSYNFYPATGGASISLPTNSFVQTGLSTNTAYAADVTAVNGSGESPQSSTAAVYTMAAPPNASQVIFISTNFIAVSWNQNANPAGTEFGVQIATRADFLGASTQTVSMDQAFFTPLQLATTYFMQAWALNGDGIASAPDVAVQAVTYAGYAPEIYVGNLRGTDIGVSSIAWSWQSVQFATAYSVYEASSPATLLGTTTNFSFTESGLSANTAYGVEVQAFDTFGTGPLSPVATAYTLAQSPGSPQLLEATPVTLSVAWSRGANPSGTAYMVRLAASADFASAISQTLVSTSAVFSGLVPSTPYYLDVSASNGDGIATPFSATTQVQTLAAPSGIALGVSSISWTWATFDGASTYQVYPATNTASALGGASGQSFVEVGLATNTAYEVLVSSSGSGSLGELSSAVYTLAAIPGAAQLVDVGTASVSVSWSANTNPAGTGYLIVYSTSPDFVHASSEPAPGTAWGIGTPLAGTTYYVRICALNGAGILTAPGPVTAIVTASVVTVAVSSSAATTISFSAPKGPVSMVIPAQAFSETLTSLTLSQPNSFPTAPSPGAALTGTGIGIQIVLNQALQPRVPVALSIGYSGVNQATFNSNNLVIARFDPVDNVWVPLPSNTNTTEQAVMASTNHFSLFQIMTAAAAPNLSAPKVFPNPFRPALGHTVITFSNLPAFTTLKIYDILGERVRTLSADAAGLASWDSKNSNGSNVASGVYFVLAGSGSSRTTFKVAIQR